MATFTWVPDRGVTRNIEMRVNEVSFGDGYSQRTDDGINPMNVDVPLSFTLRTKDEINSIDDFLVDKAGSQSFDWTNPRGQNFKYICKSWAPTYNHDGDCSLTCTFKRVYES
jgi:phage-related protein